MPLRLIDEFDRLIHRDPGARGLIASEPEWGRLCSGHLAQAATHLAEFGAAVGLVTGFFVPHADPPAAETDGPPGTMLLASALRSLGMRVVVLTDEPCAAAVKAAAEADRFGADDVYIYPNGRIETPDDFFTRGPGRGLTHLIAVERVGPNHTLESLGAQPRSGPCPTSEFEILVPPEFRDRCHNMRGTLIDEHTAPLHRLFEELQRFSPDAKTIGIGDGANEIGMGSIAWEELNRRLDGGPGVAGPTERLSIGAPHQHSAKTRGLGEFDEEMSLQPKNCPHLQSAGRIPCRIATDWTIVAGTSNWGAYALAAATLLLRGRLDALVERDRRHQHAVLEHMVAHGPAVDGVTARQQATVDGLPFLTYMQPWEGIRRLLGFDR